MVVTDVDVGIANNINLFTEINKDVTIVSYDYWKDRVAVIFHPDKACWHHIRHFCCNLEIFGRSHANIIKPKNRPQINCVLNKKKMESVELFSCGMCLVSSTFKNKYMEKINLVI